MEIITDKATSFKLVERCYELRGTFHCTDCVFLFQCASLKGKHKNIQEFLYIAEEVKTDG